MKTFVSVGIGLIIGIAIGIAASFKAAEKKAEEKFVEELASEREAMRNGNTEESEPNPDFTDDDSNPFDDYEEKVEEYKPAKKPYILEDLSDDEQNDILDSPIYNQIEIVYDRDLGRVADEDGCEYAQSFIRSNIGWNNLQKLYSDDRFPRAEGMHIVDETNGTIYLAHAGDIYEFLEETGGEGLED